MRDDARVLRRSMDVLASANVGADAEGETVMFFDDQSTDKLGLGYGGAERPLEGELSEAHKARVDAEEAEMKAEQERLNAAYREEVARMVQTLPAAWRGWVRVDTRRDVEDLFRVVQKGGFNR